MMMNRGCGRFLMIVSLIATILAFAQLAVASDDQNFGINIDLSNSYFGTILKERTIAKLRVQYGRGRERTNALIVCPVNSDTNDVKTVSAVIYAPGFGSSCTAFSDENSTRLYDLQYPSNDLDRVPELFASHEIVFVCPESPAAGMPVPGSENDIGDANLIKAARALIQHQPCEKYGIRVNLSQIAVVGYSLGGGRALRAASASLKSDNADDGQRQRRSFFRRAERSNEGDKKLTEYLFKAVVAFNPFNGYVNVEDVHIPTLMITGADDVVVRDREVSRIYDERIKADKKALIIIRNKEHNEGVQSGIAICVAFIKFLFEEKSKEFHAAALIKQILARGGDDTDKVFQSVRSQGF